MVIHLIKNFEDAVVEADSATIALTMMDVHNVNFNIIALYVTSVRQKYSK